MTDVTNDPQADALTAKLKALGLYTADQAATDSWARLLVLGPSKQGKTVCCSRGLPDLLIINCDGMGATRSAANHGSRFHALDVDDAQSWKEACRTAVQLASDGIIQSILVDTVTILQDSLIDDFQRKGREGRDLWADVLSSLTKGIKTLKNAAAHLVVIAHQIPSENEAEGIIPMLAGKAAQKVPALLHDVALFNYDAARTHDVPAVQNRWFAIGPQANWNYGCRNLKTSCQIPADMPTLFAELGVPL